MRNGESEPQNPREAVGGVSGRDLETIAAFIDRRLSAEERRAFMRRLDTEEELYEVFVETVRYRDQSAAGQAEVAEHPSSSRRWPLLAAAAAIVVVAVTPVVLLNLPAGRYAPRLVADGRLAPALDDGWLEKGWSTMRGPAPGTGEFDTAFRLGVRQVDLADDPNRRAGTTVCLQGLGRGILELSRLTVLAGIPGPEIRTLFCCFDGRLRFFVLQCVVTKQRDVIEAIQHFGRKLL